MKSRARRRVTQDGGFTLVELLIGIAVLGIIMPVITSAFSVIVRNNPMVQTRADDSRSTRGLTTWLPQDVLSTPPNLITDGSSTPGYTVASTRGSDCTGAAGTNVLHMVWQENPGSGVVNYVANYRYVTSGTTTQVKRYSCSGSGTPPYANTAVLNATTAVTGNSVSASPVYSGARLAFIDVTLTTTSGLNVLIRAASRNPAKVLG